MGKVTEISVEAWLASPVPKTPWDDTATEAEVKRWSFVLDSGSGCLLSPGFVLSIFYRLPSISFFSCFLLLPTLFLYFPPLLPSTPPNSWVGREADALALTTSLPYRQAEAPGLFARRHPELQLHVVSCIPDYRTHRAGSKVGFKELPTVLPTVRCCKRAMKWLSSRAEAGF